MKFKLKQKVRYREEYNNGIKRGIGIISYIDYADSYTPYQVITGYNEFLNKNIYGWFEEKELKPFIPYKKIIRGILK